MNKIAMIPLPLIAVAAANAAPVNGGFENGLTGWSQAPTTGVTPIEIDVKDASFGITPPEGNFQGFLETSDIDGIEPNDMEAFFSLPAGSINALGYDDPSGVGIGQTVNVNAGDTLRFDFNFLTNELTPGDPGYTTSPAFDDFAVLIADNQVHVLRDVNFAGFALSAASLRNSESKESGYDTFEYVFTNDGPQFFGFAVFNVSDISNQSALLVDDVRIGAIPTPSAAVLIVATLLPAVATSRRRRATRTMP